ncbi:MAG: hypothetical protein ICV66_01360 [Chitinophagaceae bacterium]|nr:hypothetical protein [Chitinophagaceae bacterium]
MFYVYVSRLIPCCILLLQFSFSSAQNTLKLKYPNSSVYAGIEVGSKGVKMTLVEVDNNAKRTGAYNVLKDTSINTDFISFTEPTFQVTLKEFTRLYASTRSDYKIPSYYVFTMISSGVKMQADKEEKKQWVKNLIDSFKRRINEPNRQVTQIDVLEESRLSHLGIIPEAKRYNTFLIDIGSGNSKGGYFPNGNTKDFRLFQLNWGTKSVANAVEKRLEDDRSLRNFNIQLARVLAGAEHSDIIYAVNESGSYRVSDNIAISGGIAWAVATLIAPELFDNPVVPVTYADVVKFSERLYNDFESLSDEAIRKTVKNRAIDKDKLAREVRRIHQVFDQRSLMAGTGLMLKIMRQFESIYVSKQFYLVKNGQVGWISAYVAQTAH